MSRTKKPLKATRFIGFALNLLFWFVLAWIIASILPTNYSGGWGIGAMAFNIIMSFSMISIFLTLVTFTIKFLINSFSFSKKNLGGKILLPILGIVMIIFSLILAGVLLGWISLMFKDVIFRFNAGGFEDYLKINFDAKSFYLPSPIPNPSLLEDVVNNVEVTQGFSLFVTSFVFGLLWSACGIVYAIFDKFLSKKSQAQSQTQISEQ